MIYLVCLFLPLQDLYWYEHYEEAEKAYQKGEYSLCLQHVEASLAVKPQAKKAEIIRAVQKIEYKPNYYKALALFKLGHIDEAVGAASLAAQGEVVSSSLDLQNDLFPIMREYSRRIQIYRQEINQEQVLINRRREILNMLAEERFEAARSTLAQVDASQRDRFGDIVYILDMIDSINLRAQSTRSQSLDRIDRYIQNGQAQSAQALFLALRDDLDEATISAFQSRIDQALLDAASDTSQPPEVDPVEQERLRQQLEDGIAEINKLQEQRELMRASLTSLEQQNEQLQNELVNSVSQSDNPPSNPAAFLLTSSPNQRDISVEVRLVVPAGIKSWSLVCPSASISVDNGVLVSAEADNYVFDATFDDRPYGIHLLKVDVVDRLGRHARAERLLELVRPIYLRRNFWTSVGVMACLLFIISFARQRRRKKQALMRNFNPYIAGSPVLKGDMFYGRDALVNRIVGLVHKNSLMIYGERRIGKTSLLYQIKNRLAEMSSDQYLFYPAYVDLQGVREDDLFHQIMAELLLGYPYLADELELEFRDDNVGYRSRQFSKDIKKIIECLQNTEARHVVVVLLMDEVDVINEFSEKTNQKLRGIFMKEFAEHLSCVMAGIHLKKEWESSGSPWYNFFEEIPMTNFSEQSARELILQPVQGIFEYDKDAVNLILNTTSGQPYLIQKICVSLINGKLHEHRFHIRKNDVVRVLEQMREEMKLIQGVQ